MDGFQKGKERELVGEWRRVGQRRGGSANTKCDISTGGKKKEEGDLRGISSSFFIIEFGNRWKANDLFFEFKELG